MGETNGKEGREVKAGGLCVQKLEEQEQEQEQEQERKQRSSR